MDPFRLGVDVYVAIVSVPSGSNVGIPKRQRECKGAIVFPQVWQATHMVQESQKALRSRGIFYSFDAGQRPQWWLVGWVRPQSKCWGDEHSKYT